MLVVPLIAYNTADAVMEYINQHIDSLGMDVKNNATRTLFEQICSCVITESGNALTNRLLEFVQKVICMLYETKEPLPFLTALNSVFKALMDRDLSQLYPVATELLTCVVEACHIPLLQQQRTLMLDMALNMSVKLSKVLTLLPLVMDAALMAMEQPEKQTIRKGIETLAFLVKHINRKFLLRETRRFISRIGAALGRQARSECPEVRTMAMRLIGELGALDTAIPLEHCKMDEPVRIQATFLGHTGTIHLPVKEMVEGAFNMLQDRTIDTFLLTHCFEVVRSFIIASIQVDEDKMALHRLFLHPSFTDPSGSIVQISSEQFKFPNKSVRDVHVMALTGIMLAASRQETSGRACKMINDMSGYYTLLAVAQQTGPCPLPAQPLAGRGIDSYTFIDAVMWVMALGDTEIVKPALLGFIFVIKSAAIIVGSKERARHLPLLEYMRQRAVAMCYERSSQRGGMVAIKSLVEHMAFVWTCTHAASLTRSLLHIIRDAACRVVVDHTLEKKPSRLIQIGHGPSDRACVMLEKLVIAVSEKLNKDTEDLATKRSVQARGVMEIAGELAFCVIDGDPQARHVAMNMVKFLARHQNMTVSVLLEPFKNILSNRVLPKPALLNQYSTDDKIASLEATAFCIDAAHKVFDFDPKLEAHGIFLEELFTLCLLDERDRDHYSAYDPWSSASRWGLNGWVKVRTAAAQLLAKLHYLVSYRERIILTLVDLVMCSHVELQNAGYDGLITFCSGFDISSIRDHITVKVKALLNYIFFTKFNTKPGMAAETLVETVPTAVEDPKAEFVECSEARSVNPVLDETSLPTKQEPNLCILRSTELLVRLFPEATSELTRMFVMHILATQMEPGDLDKGPAEFLSRRRHILNVVAMAPSMPPYCLEMWLLMYRDVVCLRQPSFVDGPSFLRELLVTLILAYPVAAASLLLAEKSLLDPILNSLLVYILRRADGLPLRACIQDGAGIHLLSPLGDTNQCLEGKVREVRYQTIRVIHLLAKRDTTWLVGTSPLLSKLRVLWSNEVFHIQHSDNGTAPSRHWNCPRLVGEVLLQHYIHNPTDLLLIFQLMRPLCSRYIADLKWLTNWLDTSVSCRPISQRRLLFFAFSETMATAMRSTRHQAAILGYLITPSLHDALLQSNEVLGAQSKTMDRIDPNNIPSIFAHHVLNLPIAMDDFLRVEVLKLGTLLVERAPTHVHNPTATPSQGLSGGVPAMDVLHKIVSYGWQSQSQLISTDPIVKNYGFLLMSTIISRFPMRPRIITEVTQGLLKSYYVEERPLALQSLEMAIPEMGHQLNGLEVMHGWLMDIAEKSDYAGPKVTLILQAIVRCHWVFYNLIPLGFVEFLSRQVPVMGTRSATNQQRTLAVDIVDTLIQWAERSLSSSEGPDRESMRQLTDRCIGLIDTVFRLKLAADTGIINIEWLSSILADTRSTQCQATVLKLLTCVTKHAPRRQACAIAARLHTSWINCTQPSVLPLIHILSVSLYELIPAELSHDAIVADPDCEPIDTLLNKMISEGISAMALVSVDSLEQLRVTMTTLESLMSVRPAVVDRFRDHLCCLACDLARMEGDPNCVQADAVSAILVRLLDLVNARARHLGSTFRKQFVGVVLVEVVNKTQHVVVLDAVIALAKASLTKKTSATEPDFHEMFNLLVQITPNINARFANDFALQERYLQLVHCVYKDKSLRPIVHGRKLLEPAVSMGLRSPAHETRSKFVMLLDSTVRRRLDKRLMNSVNTTFWRSLKNWTPYAIDLIFSMITTATHNPPVQQSISVSNPEHKLLGVTAILKLTGHQLSDICPTSNVKEFPPLRKELMPMMQMLEMVHDVRSATLLHSAAQLCHVRPAMARGVWRAIFPQLWQALSWDQQMQICCLSTLMTETLAPDHAAVVPSGDSIMLETLTMCQRRPEIHWGLMQYAGKYHNLWHCMTLAMEQMAVNWKPSDGADSGQHIEEGLIRMYSSMRETDLMCAVQQKRATTARAKDALTLWQLGNYDQAREMAQQVVDEIRTSSAPADHVDTLDSLSQLWNECTKELGQWDTLLEVAEMTTAHDVNLLAECSWRLQDLEELAGILPKLQGNSCRQGDWQIHMYNGYLGLLAEPYVYGSVAECVNRARNACNLNLMRSPTFPSAMHLPIMQQAHLILELEEANNLMNKVVSLPRCLVDEEKTVGLVRKTVRRWEGRTSNAADDLVHLGAIGALRQALYAAILRLGIERKNQDIVEIMVTAYENSAIGLGRTARKRWMPRTCIELLHSETDEDDDEADRGLGWQRVRQVIKAACQIPYALSKDTDIDPLTLVQELDMSSLPPASLPDAYVLAANALRLSGQSEEADSWLERALKCKGGGKACERWAERLEQDTPLDTQRALEIMRFWLAAEKETGSVSRRILAKVICLVQCCDDTKTTLALELEKCPHVRLSHWLPWIPQLIQIFSASGGDTFFQMLLKVGERYPQTVYFQVRSLYFTQKVAHEIARLSNVQAESSADSSKPSSLLIATSKLLGTILVQNLDIVSPLEKLSSEFLQLRDSWSESCVLDLRYIRLRCRTEAFAQLNDVAGAKASPGLCSFIYTRIINRGFKETMQHYQQTRWMVMVKKRVVEEFEKLFASKTGIKLVDVLIIVERWLSVIVPKCENSEPTTIMDRCRSLSSFTRFTSILGMFDEDLTIDVPSNHRVLIHGFLPMIETVRGRRWIRIRGSDGRVRAFQVVTDADTEKLRRHDRVLQMLELVNEDLAKDRETSRRRLRFAFPRVTRLSHDMQLVAVTPDIISTLQVYQQQGGKIADQSVSEFYQQVSRLQVAIPNALPDLAFRHSFYARVKLCWSKVTLQQWARNAYPDAAQFWTFRKTLTSSLALLLTAEHGLHLSRLDADGLLIDRASGNVHSNTLTFDEQQLNSAALQSRLVAFRLTESLVELLGEPHIDGPLTTSMIAVSRCLSRPSAVTPDLLRTVLVFEEPPGVKMDSAALQQRKSDWTAAIVSRFLAMVQSGEEGSVASLIQGARNLDNLCQMDPNWLPWL